jgi:hypothetical protein
MGYATPVENWTWASCPTRMRDTAAQCMSAPEEPGGGGTAGRRPGQTDPVQHEDLPYKVELWDTAKSTVELVLAVTASGGIGYAAYHAATREFPERYIVLRHRDAVLARWNGPSH